MIVGWFNGTSTKLKLKHGEPTNTVCAGVMEIQTFISLLVDKRGEYTFNLICAKKLVNIYLQYSKSKQSVRQVTFLYIFTSSVYDIVIYNIHVGY